MAAETGSGIQGLLESALGKPKNLFLSGRPSIYEMAVSYTYGIAKNYPFIDGNKRTAFIAGGVFLERNGFSLRASEADATLKMLTLAAGDFSEAEYAAWLQENSVPLWRINPLHPPVYDKVWRD